MNVLLPALLFGAPLSAVAPGVPSDPVEDAAGGVTVEVLAAAPLAAVKKIIDDPKARAALQPSILAVEVLGQDGACTRLRTTTQGMSAPFVYESRACPTATGWHDTLVQSADLSAYESSWTLTAVPGGTEVRYHCLVAIDLPVPGFLVRNGTIKSMVGTLVRLVDRLR